MENEKKPVTVPVHGLPPLPEGYGPEIYWGPQEARSHVWFDQGRGVWVENIHPTSWDAGLLHAYKKAARVMYVAIGEGWNGDFYVMATEPTRQDLNDTLLCCFTDTQAIAIVRIEEGQFDD